MPRHKTTIAQPLKIFWFDWILVIAAIVWLLFIWGFGGSPWMVLILGFGSIGWWTIGSWWNRYRPRAFSGNNLEKNWLWWWGAWLGVVGINVFTSQIPIQSALLFFWWLASFLWFCWWGSLIDVPLKRWLATQILGWGLAVLVLMNWLIAWFQPLFVLESGLKRHPNFVLPFFGHHHVAALIVLIWPVIWLLQRWLKLPQKQWRWLQVAWIGILGITVWSSFSRSAWLALFVQGMVFFWHYRHAIKTNVKVWVLSAGIFSLILVSGFLLKDLLQSKQFQELRSPIRALCYQWWTPDSLCVVAPEPRLEYWHQAFIVWQHFPLFGSGLDTFGQVMKRWQITQAFQSQNPHQMLLQVLTEQGLLGFVVWLRFFMLLFQLLRQQRSQGFDWYWNVMILGALIVGSFDFDWQLAGFWWPFLLMVSCVVPPMTHSRTVHAFWRWLTGFILVIVGFWTVLSGVTKIAIENNQIDAWIKIWPFSVEWQSQTAQKITDTKQWHAIVQRYYAHSSEVWSAAMTTVTNTSEKWVWQEQLWLINPVRYWESNPLATATQNRDNLQIQTVLSRLDNWLTTHPNSQIHRYNPAFAEELFALADDKLLLGDWETATQALRLAQIFDPWILHNKLPTIMATVPSTEKISFVLKVFASLNQNGYGDNLTKYRLWYRQLVTAETQWLAQRRQRGEIFTKNGAYAMPPQLHPVPDWVEPVKTLAQQTLVLLPDPQSRGEELSDKLAQLILLTGDDTISTQTYQVSQLYQQAQVIQPWALNARFWWFEQLELVKPETMEFLKFAADWQTAPPEKTGYKPRDWMLFYNRVLLLSLRVGNVEAAFQALKAIQHYGVQAHNLYAF